MKIWKDRAYKAAFEHARLLTAHHSRSFYMAARLLPAERRWATYALYAFCRFADNLVDHPRERSKSDLLDEIQSLTEELHRAYQTGESQHPIVQPFILVAKTYGIPIEYPLDLIRGVEMDTQSKRYQSFDDLYVFCYRVAGVVGLMMTHVLGRKSDQAFDLAEKLGVAMQLTNILRDVQEDKDMGRIYLPLEEMKQFGVSEDDIIHEKMTLQIRRLMQFQAERAHSYYDDALAGIPMLERESQFAIYAARRIYRGILQEIEARDYNPFLGRVYVPNSDKLGILMQEIVRTRMPLFPRPA